MKNSQKILATLCGMTAVLVPAASAAVQSSPVSAETAVFTNEARNMRNALLGIDPATSTTAATTASPTQKQRMTCPPKRTVTLATAPRRPLSAKAVH